MVNTQDKTDRCVITNYFFCIVGMALIQKGNILHYGNAFLQQKSDHDWLLIPLNGKCDKDQFTNTAVFVVFSADLSRDNIL